jgi:hypothetical protein
MSTFFIEGKDKVTHQYNIYNKVDLFTLEQLNFMFLLYFETT